ncbi:Abi family protein [Bacillus cereus group sp. BfR-BA-02570]|uniref:Abi family protein n=1 Tax=Bacillus cereus group sp. BfR-BA-02570 TaxID=3094890 RepID=UPI0029C275BD|nr:Abi family protein [Bacillus cereus group sp. BfR-BA-02570]MDX5746207.1 Abi family protein [Bacillus cereus group sp. BfR-BA-02570]
MALVRGKTTNGLMKHLRDEHSIEISGSKNKKELLNMGYYHGYKGYRFIKNSQNRISYRKFDEVVAVYEFDTNLKTILYPRIMLIETALKNYTLNTLIKKGPVDFEYVFSHWLNDYKKHPVGNKDYRRKMKNRLELRNKIHQSISYNYSGEKAVIQHFFHASKPIPLWAIFEVINLGEFGFFLQCLNEETRIDITKDLEMHSTSHNQNGRILEEIIFLVKELRNAVAHNSVVFDCRFRKANPQSRLKEYIQSETGIRNIMFDHIIDYFIVLIFLLKKLGISKTELKRIVKDLSEESEKLRNKIPVSVHTTIMGSDIRNKINGLNNFI